MLQFVRSYILLSLFLGSVGLFAQSTADKITHDLELWQGAKVKKFITNDFYIGLNNQARFNDRIRKFKFGFFDFQTGYRFHELFRMAMGYRYTVRLVSNDNRGYIDAIVNKRFTKIRTAIDFRLKFQIAKANITQSSVEYTLRPRLGVKYYPNNWARWNFRLYTEFFYSMNENKRAFTHYRIAFGGRYRINDQLYFNMSYLMQHKFASSFPSMSHVAYITLYIKISAKTNEMSN
ncbi:MAG: DUF2490 domain-containing protein [Aureispira sp.]|nr:DUF2490 domain-containing protein [Aureispira sp.]